MTREVGPTDLEIFEKHQFEIRKLHREGSDLLELVKQLHELTNHMYGRMRCKRILKEYLRYQ